MENGLHSGVIMDRRVSFGDSKVLFGRSVSIVINEYNYEELKCDFTIRKSLKLEPNTCDLTIYNLDHDLTLIERVRKTGVVVKIGVGYNNIGTDLIFYGNLRSGREEYIPPNWVLTLSAGDGEKATQTAGTNQTFGPGTPINTVLRALIYQINLSLGATKLSNKEAEGIINNATFSSGGYTLASGITISDNAVKELSMFAEACNLEISFQDNKLQVLNKRDVINQQLVSISSESGMIGKAEIDEKGNAHFQHLIVPGLKPGMKIQIFSDVIITRWKNARGEDRGTPVGLYGPSGTYRIESIVYNGSTIDINNWTMDVEASLIKERKFDEDYQLNRAELFPNG